MKATLADPNALHCIPGDRDAPRKARRIVTDTLGVGCLLLEDAMLVASELVTNSVRHSRSSHPGGLVGLTIEKPDDGVVRVEVIDNGPLPEKPTQPAVRPSGCLRDFGFGLGLVDSLADDWGVIHHERNGYRAVWALLSADGETSEMGATDRPSRNSPKTPAPDSSPN